MAGLTNMEIMRIVNRWIGVSGGYLGDFSYRTHADFYPEYCDLDINPYNYEGTTRERFIAILSSLDSSLQAKILRGVLERFPLSQQNAPSTRTEELRSQIEEMIKRLEQVQVPQTTLSIEQFDTNRKLQVFLCHSSQDKSQVHNLYKRLLAEGWIDPWLDEIKIKPGQDWELEIERAVEHTDAVVVCFSKSSISKEGFIQKEIKMVLDKSDEKPEGAVFIIPLLFEDCDIPLRFKKWQRLDVAKENWYSLLVESLRIRADKIDIFSERPERIKYFLELKNNLEKRDDLRILNDAINEAEALYMEGKLPHILQEIFISTRKKFYDMDNTKNPLLRKLEYLKRVRDGLENRIMKNEFNVYDVITDADRPTQELLREANMHLEQTSKDALAYIFEIVNNALPNDPSFAAKLLRDQLGMPFYEFQKRSIELRLNEIEKLIK